MALICYGASRVLLQLVASAALRSTALIVCLALLPWSPVASALESQALACHREASEEDCRTACLRKLAHAAETRESSDGGAETCPMHENVRSLPAMNGCEPADRDDGILGSESPRLLLSLSLDVPLEGSARVRRSPSEDRDTVAHSPLHPPPQHTTSE